MLVLVNRHILNLFTIILFVLWLLAIWPIYAPSDEATLFFLPGASTALHEKDLFALDSYGKWILGGYAALLVVEAILRGSMIASYLHRTEILFGAGSALFASKVLVRIASWRRQLFRLSAASFFVFAAHEPLLTVMKKLTFLWLLPTTLFEVLVVYFGVPISVICLLLMLFRVLETYSPKILSTIGGAAFRRQLSVRN